MNWALLHKYLSDECSPSEKKKVEQWIKSDQSNQDFFDSLCKVWSVEPGDDINVNAEKAWKKVREDLEQDPLGKQSRFTDDLRELNTDIHRRRKYNWSTALSIAATVVIVALTSVYLFMPDVFTNRQAGTQPPQVQEVSTQPGQRTSFRLADGSRVSLNADSKIRIPPEFGDSLRKVYLEGEAYFEVTSNPNIPFIVRSGNSYTRVLGTKFGVKAYPGDQDVQIVVKEGEVMVGAETANKEEAQKLTKNTLGRIGTDGKTHISRVKKITKYLAWKDGRLIFDSTPFREVIPRLERWYNIQIVADSSLASQKVTATFEDEPMIEVLNILAISLDAQLKRENRKINFKSKQ